MFCKVRNFIEVSVIYNSYYFTVQLCKIEFYILGYFDVAIIYRLFRMEEKLNAQITSTYFFVLVWFFGSLVKNELYLLNMSLYIDIYIESCCRFSFSCHSRQTKTNILHTFNTKDTFGLFIFMDEEIARTAKLKQLNCT